MDTLLAFRHPIETIRTAPVYVGYLAAASTVYFIASEALTSGQHMTMAALAVPAATLYVGFDYVACGSMDSIRNLITKRERIADSVTTHGFNERILQTTTNEWCSRQAARVALEPFNMVDQYEELCAQNTAREFPELPHI